MALMRLRHQLVLASVVISLVVVAMVGGPLLYDRASREDAADRRLVDTAHAMAEHAARSLNPLEILLGEEAEDLVTVISAGGLTPIGAHRMLQRHYGKTPQLLDMAYVDANGDLYGVSGSPKAPRINLAFRDYFKAHRDRPELGLYVGKPIVMRQDNRPAIPVSCRLEGPDGRFLGVLVALLDPSYFQAFYDAASRVDDHSIALVDLSGRILAASTRFPGTPQPKTSGERLAGKAGALLDGLERGQDSAGPSSIDFDPGHGKRLRRASVARVPGWPLAIVDAQRPDTVLSGWRTLASIMAGVTALFLLCVAGLTAFGLRSIAREEKTKKRLAKSRDQLELHAGELEQIARALVSAKADAERNRDDAERSRDEAERANRHKSEFLARMSHELRTPLNAIIGFSEIIRDQVLGEDRKGTYREYAGHISDAGQLLLSLINDVLDIAKIEAGRMQLRMERVDPTAAATLSVELMQAMASSRQICIGLEVAGDLGTLTADARALRQIIVNLLSNAVKFTLPGGQVKVGVGRGAGGIEIAVSDTGIGMNDSEIEIAMQEFGQIDSALTRTQPGTGLGLPLTKRLVELHGGTFRLASVPGIGTTATVWLPQEAMQAAA
jgi:two-component system, cell cycle sensor histidine kinase PleC